MRIALVVTGGVDESGRERIIPALVWLVAHLAQDHDVHVYVLRYLEAPRTYALRGATVHDLGRPAGLRRQHRALLDALRRDGPFDVLHGYWALPAGVLAAVAGRRLGIPSVVTLDSGEFVWLPDIEYGNQGRWTQRLAVRAATTLATRLTTCTAYQAGLAAAHGVRARVIPWGIDATRLPAAARTDGPPWRLLQVANLNPVKNQPLLIEAFRRLLDAGLAIHLDIVGQDTLGGTIQRLAEARGVGRHVTFHGFLPTDAIAPLYGRAHLLVVSSRHEAAGVVALEAAACGVPAIGRPVGYLADWTPDRAFTVSDDTADGLARAIREALADPDTRSRVADRARRWALAHDAAWTAAQFSQIYQEARGSHRSSARHAAAVRPGS